MTIKTMIVNNGKKSSWNKRKRRRETCRYKKMKKEQLIIKWRKNLEIMEDEKSKPIQNKEQKDDETET